MFHLPRIIEPQLVGEFYLIKSFMKQAVFIALFPWLG